MKYYTINPTTEEVLQEYNYEGLTSVMEKLDRSDRAFYKWKAQSYEQRAVFIRSLKDYLLENCDRLAESITLEMGKPFIQAQGEIKKCADVCEYYANYGEEFLNDVFVSTKYQKSYVSYQPMGVILGIMPWNFPYWQVLRFAVPTLMAGNTVLIKHAPNVTQCMKNIEQMFLDLCFPEGVFEAIYADTPEVEPLIASHKVQGVSLTGSERAGRAVAELAGRYLKKCVLELGGSDPYLVLKDADVEVAAQACVSSRFLNTGQSCVAAKRWIVDQKIIKEFTKRVKSKISKIKFSDPTENPDIGPIARKDLLVQLHMQVKKSISLGAEVLCGCELPQDKGFFYPASLLTKVAPGMPAFDEELFGPVASIIEVQSEEQAIEYANQSQFGLGGAIFSKDVVRAEGIAKTQIQTGGIFINDFLKSQPELPFGGIKSSGMGRELSEFGIREFTYLKTVVVS